MLEIKSALSSIYAPGPLGLDSGRAALSIHERIDRTLVQMSGWPESFDQIAADICRRLGLALPGDCRTAISAGDRTVFRVGPERLWIAGSAGDQMLGDIARANVAAVVTDIGHSRVVIRIAGENAAQCLNRGLPVDLDDGVLAEGGFVQSVVNHVPVLVHRTISNGGKTFDIYLPREYAVWFWEWLLVAASSFGCVVRCRQ